MGPPSLPSISTRILKFFVDGAGKDAIGRNPWNAIWKGSTCAGVGKTCVVEPKGPG